MTSNIFPSTWYFPVPVKAAGSNVFWVNKKLLGVLNTLTENFYKLFSLSDLVSNYNLGITSYLYTDSFVSEESWEKYLQGVKILQSERFFNPYSPDIGSGRSAIFDCGAWKGIGRNHAASRIDYVHCHGGMSYLESLIEVSVDRLLNSIDPESHVPLLGAFCYKDQNSSFIIRSSDSIRCGQIVGGIKKPEIDAIYSYLNNRMPGLDSNQWFQFVMDRFVRLMKIGVVQTSATRDNICIDGRLIDNATIDCVMNGRGHNFFCQIYFNESLDNSNISSDDLNWKRFFAHEIRNIATPFNHFSAKFHGIRFAYNLLGLSCPDWNDYTSRVEFPFCFSSDLYNFENWKLRKNIEEVYEFFLLAEKQGVSISTYSLSSKSVLITSGTSFQKDLRKIFSKLLKINSGFDGRLNHQDLTQILLQVLKSYGLEP